MPKRSTVLEIAERLQMKPDPLLLKAGYVPHNPQRGEDDEYLLLLLGQLDHPQRAAVRAYIEHVKDFDVIRRPRSS